MNWKTAADWATAIGTLVLAAAAVFLETIRGWFYRPQFEVSVKTEPPDCQLMMVLPAVLTLMVLMKMSAGVALYWGMSNAFGAAQGFIGQRFKD